MDPGKREFGAGTVKTIKNKIILVACGVCVAAAAYALFSIFVNGPLTAALIAQAERTANQWFIEQVRQSKGDVRAALGEAAGADTRFAKGAVDAAIVISNDGTVRTVGGSASDAATHLVAIVEHTSGPGSLKTGRAETLAPLAPFWLTGPEYQTWVVMPLAAGSVPGADRLAIRVVQSGTAMALKKALWMQIIYFICIGLTIFLSFLAGYRLRLYLLAPEGDALRYLALHDELTGLPNRKQFEDRLGEAVATASGEGHRVALLILDLDGFKSINDTLGHLAGDELLRSVGERLGRTLRDSDLLARLSGDEFAILVRQITDISQITPMADRILEMMAEPIVIEKHEVTIGCSIGIAVAPDNGDTSNKLIRNADFALYRAKAEGKSTWRFFNPKMAEDLKSRRMIEDGLREALANDQFTLLYQPQYDLNSGEIRGYEALLRWLAPGRGMIPTAVFLSVAEETGLIVPIGEWVISRAIADCARLPEHIRVAINLSPAQLARDGIEDFIKEALETHQVAPHQIEIEVNESILGRNEASAFERLERIRDIGVAIVMDNFGVGRSSLGLLSRYPFDKIKVDRSFMDDVDVDQKTRAVVAAICNLGRSLGMTVAGEGVETAEHAKILKAAGFNQCQGYHFGRPRGLETIIGELEKAGAPQAARSA